VNIRDYTLLYHGGGLSGEACMDEEEVDVIASHHEVVAVVAPPEVLMGDVAISVEVADATKPRALRLDVDDVAAAVEIKELK
jgi:hypothetical protein